MGFVTRKVFDWGDMPSELNQWFADYRAQEAANGSYIPVWVKAGEEDEGGLNKWLIENGAEDGEMVLISYGW